MVLYRTKKIQILHPFGSPFLVSKDCKNAKCKKCDAILKTLAVPQKDSTHTCDRSTLVIVPVPKLRDCQEGSGSYSLVLSNMSSANPKRFYKKVGILKSNGDYEICLDHRKLKTPNGQLFKVSSEPLALAIAAEWDSQHDKIQRSNMHLTAICNTVIDNPSRLTKFDLVQNIVNFLDTDTILYHCNEDEELCRLQEKEWGTLLNWFNERYKTNISSSVDIAGPTIDPKDRATVQRHILSYSFDIVMGINFAVETLKSVMLTLACIDRKLSIEEAVHLSKLEEEYQIGHWGRVEWAHDLHQMELQSRLAAAVLYIHLNSIIENNDVKKKVSSG